MKVTNVKILCTQIINSQAQKESKQYEKNNKCLVQYK